MRYLFSLPAILLFQACATALAAPPSFQVDLTLSGRVVSTTEIIAFCDTLYAEQTKELKAYCGDAAFDARMITLETADSARDKVKFTSTAQNCPSSVKSEQQYLVTLHRQPGFLYQAQGEQVWENYNGLVLVGCAPIDAETSAGFLFE